MGVGGERVIVLILLRSPHVRSYPLAHCFVGASCDCMCSCARVFFLWYFTVPADDAWVIGGAADATLPTHGGVLVDAFDVVVYV